MDERRTPFAIPFRAPLAIAGAVCAEYRGVLVERRDAGIAGVGEASAACADPQRRAGEIAALDLAARARGLRVVDLLGGARRPRVSVNALLVADDPDACAREASTYAACGFRALKLKLHPSDQGLNQRRIAAVRAAVEPAVAVRVDANAAWSVAEAVAALRPLLPFGLEYVEQPVRRIAELAALRRAVPIPLAADESATGPDAVEAIAAQGAADVIVLKPTRLGLRTALAMATVARQRALDVVVTSALDTSIGIAAALHLACAVDAPLRACGLATGGLLAGDLVAAPLRTTDGWLALPSGPGLGVALDPAARRTWALRAPLAEWETRATAELDPR